MQLTELITDPHVDHMTIAAFLDNLAAPQRWTQLQVLDRAHQRALYQKATPGAIDLNHFAPAEGVGIEVIHDGLNTLPVAPPLRRFQKRFCRPGAAGRSNRSGDDAGGFRLFGYNEGPLRRFIGPGYFVATETNDHPQWKQLGGVVVDYFQTPDEPVVAGWPRVVPNSKGLQRFVYDRTRDFLRRVSTHVSIGAAHKNDRPLDHYFVLCRRD
jgi:hypothetical protein